MPMPKHWLFSSKNPNVFIITSVAPKTIANETIGINSLYLKKI